MWVRRSLMGMVACSSPRRSELDAGAAVVMTVERMVVIVMEMKKLESPVVVMMMMMLRVRVRVRGQKARFVAGRQLGRVGGGGRAVGRVPLKWRTSGYMGSIWSKSPLFEFSPEVLKEERRFWRLH